MTRLFIALALAVVTTGCGTLKQRLQTSRFDSPESNGTDRRFNFDIEAAQANTYMAVSDMTAKPPDLAHPTTDDVTQLGLGVSATLIDRHDQLIYLAVLFGQRIAQDKNSRCRRGGWDPFG